MQESVNIQVTGLPNSGKSTLINKYFDTSATKKWLKSLFRRQANHVEMPLEVTNEQNQVNRIVARFYEGQLPKAVESNAIIVVVDLSNPHAISNANKIIETYPDKPITLVATKSKPGKVTSWGTSLFNRTQAKAQIIYAHLMRLIKISPMLRFLTLKTQILKKFSTPLSIIV